MQDLRAIRIIMTDCKKGLTNNEGPEVSQAVYSTIEELDNDTIIKSGCSKEIKDICASINNETLQIIEQAKGSYNN